jgi:hypothetical protein
VGEWTPVQELEEGPGAAAAAERTEVEAEIEEDRKHCKGVETLEQNLLGVLSSGPGVVEEETEAASLLKRKTQNLAWVVLLVGHYKLLPNFRTKT